MTLILNTMFRYTIKRQNFKGNDENQCHDSGTSLSTLRIYKGQENGNGEICEEDQREDNGAMSIPS